MEKLRLAMEWVAERIPVYPQVEEHKSTWVLVLACLIAAFILLQVWRSVVWFSKRRPSVRIVLFVLLLGLTAALFEGWAALYGTDEWYAEGLSWVLLAHALLGALVVVAVLVRALFIGLMRPTTAPSVET